jgi:hypothetical protein
VRITLKWVTSCLPCRRWRLACGGTQRWRCMANAFDNISESNCRQTILRRCNSVGIEKMESFFTRLSFRPKIYKGYGFNISVATGIHVTLKRDFGIKVRVNMTSFFLTLAAVWLRRAERKFVKRALVVMFSLSCARVLS